MTDQATPPPPSAPQAGHPAPYGQDGAGAYPPPNGDGYAPAAPQGAAPAKSKAGGIVKRIVGAVVVFGVISIGGVAYAYLSGAPETAKVGDCLSGQSAEALKTIDCTDPAAEHKVVGKIEDKTEAEFEGSDVETLCAAHPTSQNAFWEGERGGTGYVLCLEPLG